MTGPEIRELRDADRDQSAALGALAFGGDPLALAAPARPGARTWGLFEGDRLLAKATLRSYVQWWGGRRVPMGGLASVAVHPDARGRGSARALLRVVLAQQRADGQPLSVLYPTAPGIYRALGWELAGSLTETVLPTAALRGAGDPGTVTVRSAGLADVPALAALRQAQGEVTDGLLTRDGASFPRGAEDVLAHDVVTLAEQDGRPVGYLAYDRGRGYGPTAELRVDELVAATAPAAAALLRSLATWDSVAGSVRWRGPVDELGRLLPAALPPPVTGQPWMLRVVDAPAAVAARGWPPAVRTRAAFTLVDGQVPEHAGPWQLTVADGRGVLERTGSGPPRLAVRGLALLYAGVAGTGALRRAGLLAGDVPGLDGLAGPAPRLLDHF